MSRPRAAGGSGRSRPGQQVGMLPETCRHTYINGTGQGFSPLISCAVNSYGLILKAREKKERN